MACVRVLVVEDELRMAALLKRGLQEDGYVVDIAATGTDAVWQAGEFDYDVVLLDLMLPGLDGVEVCRQLRQIGPVGTGPDAQRPRRRGRPGARAGRRCRRLPRQTVQLRRAVGAGARSDPPRRDRASDGAARSADLRLDPATRQAWRGDTELELSGKEFALLELFLRRPGEVLTRTRILEHVWDFAYDGVSNVVDQYVLYLRRKVDRPFGVDSWRPFAARGTACVSGRRLQARHDHLLNVRRKHHAIAPAAGVAVRSRHRRGDHARGHGLRAGSCGSASRPPWIRASGPRPGRLRTRRTPTTHPDRCRAAPPSRSPRPTARWSWPPRRPARRRCSLLPSCSRPDPVRCVHDGGQGDRSRVLAAAIPAGPWSGHHGGDRDRRRRRRRGTRRAGAAARRSAGCPARRRRRVAAGRSGAPARRTDAPAGRGDQLPGRATAAWRYPPPATRSRRWARRCTPCRPGGRRR